MKWGGRERRKRERRGEGSRRLESWRDECIMWERRQESLELKCSRTLLFETKGEHWKGILSMHNAV